MWVFRNSTLIIYPARLADIKNGRFTADRFGKFPQLQNRVFRSRLGESLQVSIYLNDSHY